MINGNEPRIVSHDHASGRYIIGITKREQFAMAAMQGMCGNSDEQVCKTTFEAMTRAAVAMADLLLKALEADQ